MPVAFYNVAGICMQDFGADLAFKLRPPSDPGPYGFYLWRTVVVAGGVSAFTALIG